MNHKSVSIHGQRPAASFCWKALAAAACFFFAACGDGAGGGSSGGRTLTLTGLDSYLGGNFEIDVRSDVFSENEHSYTLRSDTQKIETNTVTLNIIFATEDTASFLIFNGMETPYTGKNADIPFNVQLRESKSNTIVAAGTVNADFSKGNWEAEFVAVAAD